MSETKFHDNLFDSCDISALESSSVLFVGLNSYIFTSLIMHSLSFSVTFITADRPVGDESSEEYSRLASLKAASC